MSEAGRAGSVQDKQRAGSAGSIKDKQKAGSAGARSDRVKAGKRSGLRRKAGVALVIKKYWLAQILAGKKVWEIRSGPTKRRGWIHLAQSKSGKIRGGANLMDCFRIKRSEFMKYQSRHCVPNLNDIKYKNIWAWVLQGAEYTVPFDYEHSVGAVIFVGVRQPMGPQPE